MANEFGWVADGGADANGLGLGVCVIRGNKKTASYPPMGQELHSCDTTQFDVKRPLAYAYHHTRPCG